MVRDPYCPICGLPLSPDAPGPYHCGDCLDGKYRFDRARAAGIYRGLLRRVIHRFKYEGHIALARPLSRMLIPASRELTARHEVALIVPVPLHPRRLRERGFNQSSLVARHLGVSLKIPVAYSALNRSRWTEPQTGLSVRQRAANVRGAFELGNREVVRGKEILLVDDVLTTGETVNQCARVLKSGGATKILVLTVARTAGL